MSGQTRAGVASSDSSAHSTSRSYSRTVRRYYRKRDAPLGWWPWGILPLLGLVGLFLYGLLKTAPDIQNDTQSSVQANLVKAGYMGLGVYVDGQHIVVTGTGDEKDEARVASIARGSTCDTWIAPDLVCPTRVGVDLSTDKAAVVHNFEFIRGANGIVLRGDVPNEDIRKSILADARAKFTDVTDSLRVTGLAAMPGYQWAADKAWAVLADVTSGGARWSDGVLSAWGRTTRDLEARLRSGFESSEYPNRIGDFRLQIAEEVDACNTQLAELLGQSTINFRTASAVISANSQSLLDRIADVAKGCPGDLIVEGHTDNVGDAAYNKSLSRQRAQAVVDALTKLGIDPNRLTASGFGEDRPRASNNTPAGRAQNRRIEIKVADLN
ncbi:MAG: OmpA family protein [Rhodothermales bacterium]